MSRRLPAACALLALSGCARFDRPFDASLPASGLTGLRALVDRGDLSVAGTSEGTFELTGTSTGYGRNKARAAEHEAGNAVTLGADGNDAVLVATSAAHRAWVTMDLATPSKLDLDLRVDRGSVDVEGVEGDHRVAADRITAVRLAGSADLQAASGGMDVDVWPWDDGRVQLDSSAGDVVLRLPWGRPYDVEVIGDPSYDMQIEDLGFQGTFSEPGYFSGTVGDGSIPVSVYVNGGSFELLESL